MKKIKCNPNDKIEIYVNGVPDLTSIPKDEFKALISALEREIFKTKAEEQKSDNARKNKE